MSLLGTWSGKGTENWSSSSNILQVNLQLLFSQQVVVSIQGLILGASKPFFLEAGYDKLKGTAQGEHQAKLYNESAFLLSLESIPTLLARIPLPFEAIILTHFENHGQELIDQCKDYLTHTEERKGRLIEKPSTGFVKALQRILPKVEESLRGLEAKKLQK